MLYYQHMKSYKTIKRQLLKHKSIRREYEKLETESMLAKLVIEKRLAKGLTQTDLARKITGRKFWYLVKKNMYGRGDHIATIQAPDFAQAVIKAKHYVDQNNIIGDWEVTSAD